MLNIKTLFLKSFHMLWKIMKIIYMEYRYGNNLHSETRSLKLRFVT